MKKSKQLSRKLFALYVVALLVVGFAGGFAATQLLKDRSPKNIVWVADETVKAPKDLLRYLEKSTKDDCKGYQGDNSPQGVSLVAVYKVVQDKYANVALGCSTNLDDGFPVIKTNNGWQLISAPAYYVSFEAPADTSDLSEPSMYPRCSLVDKYKISQEFAPQCLEDKGQENPELDESDIRQVTYQ